MHASRSLSAAPMIPFAVTHAMLGAGKAVARHALRWAPYYGMKITVYRALHRYGGRACSGICATESDCSIGAPRTYRRLLEANRRLTPDPVRRIQVNLLGRP